MQRCLLFTHFLPPDGSFYSNRNILFSGGKSGFEERVQQPGIRCSTSDRDKIIIYEVLASDNWDVRIVIFISIGVFVPHEALCQMHGLCDDNRSHFGHAGHHWHFYRVSGLGNSNCSCHKSVFLHMLVILLQEGNKSRDHTIEAGKPVLEGPAICFHHSIFDIVPDAVVPGILDNNLGVHAVQHLCGHLHKPIICQVDSILYILDIYAHLLHHVPLLCHGIPHRLYLCQVVLWPSQHRMLSWLLAVE